MKFKDCINSLNPAKKLLSATILLGASLGSVFNAAAQPSGYPDRPITIVVPFSAGGSTDQIGRMIAQHLNKTFHVPVVVDNKPGANGTIGNIFVSRAKPDGHTLLIGGTDIVASQFLYKNLPYNPETSFTPIGIVSEFPFLMVVDKKSNIKTVKEFISFVKQNPMAANFASAGIGNSTHLAGETFKIASGLENLVHVPFNGSSQALMAVMSGQVSTVLDTAITAAPNVNAQKLTALAVVSKERLLLFPDVPTMSELGYTQFDKMAPWSWKGLFAPANTPPEVIKKLHDALNVLLQDPEFRKYIESNASLIVPPQSTADTVKFLGNQRKGWSKLISDAKVELQ